MVLTWALAARQRCLGGQVGTPRPRVRMEEEPAVAGSGRSRVEDLLLGILKICTQQHYAAVLESFATRLEESEGMTVNGMDEPSLDHWVPDWMVENGKECLAIAGAAVSAPAGSEAPIPRSFLGPVLSATLKTRPR